VSYRDEKDALRAEREVLEEALREKDARLRKLEQKVKRLTRRNKRLERATVDEPRETPEMPIRKISSQLPKGLLAVAFLAIYMFADGSWPVALIIGSICAVAIYQTYRVEPAPRKVRVAMPKKKSRVAIEPRAEDIESEDEERRISRRMKA
jgi:hypothetical protein